MPLTPFNAQHQQQIAAGTKGRLRGHHFENQLASEINTLSFPAINVLPNQTPPPYS